MARIQRPDEHQDPGFTLVEILALFVMLECILLGIVLVHEMIGGKVGLLLGGGFGVVLFIVGGSIWSVLKDLADGGIPRLPRCKHGTCRGPGILFGDGDYTCHKIGEKDAYLCRHGGQYTRLGRRFMAVNDDGSVSPYLIWRSFRGWFPDDTTEKRN